MATCPAGHTSAATDYCDECGLPMTPAAPPTAPLPAVATVAVLTCANCGAPRDGRFCEECGHDATAPAPAPDQRPPGAPAFGAAGWSAVIRADRGWFDEVRRREGPDAAALEFPRYHPELRFELTDRQLAIGRRSRSRGTDPDIDLSGPQLDPGVSAQHALLIPGPAGWEIVDLGSTNGTSVNEDPTTIPPHTPVPLAGGDRVHLGAWTTITVVRGGA